MSEVKRSYHAKFYVPIIVLWGAAFLSTLDPVFVQSNLRFDSYFQRNDLLQIDRGGELALDDLIIYRPDWTDSVAQVIGVPGDEIALGLDGRSIVRNGERVVVARSGFEIGTTSPGMLAVEDGQVAIFVQNQRRNTFMAVVSQDAVRGKIEKIYRYSDLDRSDWLTIGFYSLIVLGLIVMPYAAFARQSPQTLSRIVILVTHSFLTIVVAGSLIAASLPGDPLRVGAGDPIWWWFPLVVVSGFGLELVLAVGLFLGVQWLAINQPWRRGELNNLAE